MEKNNIAIIGAGVSGLAAAIELSKSGVSCDLYEARDSLGGRVNSIYVKKVDEVIDNGQHLLVGAYKEFLNLLETIDVDNRLLLEFQKINIEYRNLRGESFFLKSNFFKNRYGFLSALLNTSLFSIKEKISVITFSFKIKSIDPEGYDNSYQLLIDNNQSENLVELLWEPLVVSTMNTSPGKASPTIFKNILTDSFFNSGNAGNLIIPKCDFSKLISSPAKKYLSNFNNNIFLNTPIKSIKRNGDYFVLTTRDNDVKYNSVILATPIYLTQRLLSDVVKYVPDYNPILSIYFWTKNKITSQKITSYSGAESQWLFNRTYIIEDFSTQYYSYQITISNPNNEIFNMKDKDIMTIVNKELNDFYKRNIEISEYKIIREKFATFAATENNNSMRPNCKTNIEGVFLAGDWVSNGYPSTLEGATINGINAAKSYLQYISKL